MDLSPSQSSGFKKKIASTVPSDQLVAHKLTELDHKLTESCSLPLKEWISQTGSLRYMYVNTLHKHLLKFYKITCSITCPDLPPQKVSQAWLYPRLILPRFIRMPVLIPWPFPPYNLRCLSFSSHYLHWCILHDSQYPSSFSKLAFSTSTQDH